MGLNDKAWKKLFDKYRILDEIRHAGSFYISAEQIKEFREPRLMTKFDHKINLPQIFVENELAILPVTRGSYVISSFQAYKEFDKPSGEVQKVSIPSYLQSLKPQFLVSEAIALNCANACGILNDFLEDDQIVSTVNGRMGSGDFGFDICTSVGSKHIDVKNAQIEIDAAFEGINYLSLFEAKRDLADDFLVRQIYYPFRVWSRRVNKPVKPVFLVFSNGTFSLYQYHFEVIGNYNSLQLVKQKNYVIETGICLADIENLLQSSPIVIESDIPFPQADNMLRIINLVELLSAGKMSRDDITTAYAFDVRQTNYYTDAGRYLGFIDKQRDKEKNIVFSLSPLGLNIMKLPLKERQLAISAQIIKHKAFRDTLKLYLQRGAMPDKESIVKIMRKANLYGVGEDSTYIRRASTVSGWIKWVLALIEEK